MTTFTGKEEGSMKLIPKPRGHATGAVRSYPPQLEVLEARLPPGHLMLDGLAGWAWWGADLAVPDSDSWAAEIRAAEGLLENQQPVPATPVPAPESERLGSALAFSRTSFDPRAERTQSQSGNRPPSPTGDGSFVFQRPTAFLKAEEDFLALPSATHHSHSRLTAALAHGSFTVLV